MRGTRFAGRLAACIVAALAACVVAVLSLGATGAGAVAGRGPSRPRSTPHPPLAPSAPTARGGVEQAYAVGLRPHARARLLAPSGRTLQSRRVDAQGGVPFRSLRPGGGDRITSGHWRSRALRVLTARAAPSSSRLYDQRIHAGYLTVRDGTRLAIDVHLPHAVPATSLLTGGLTRNASIVKVTRPYPTLIEYSGYDYADPAEPVNGIANLANLLGFAVVDVSMRGTGCSGGAFNYSTVTRASTATT